MPPDLGWGVLPAAAAPGFAPAAAPAETVGPAEGTTGAHAASRTTSYAPPFQRGPISAKSPYNYQSANPKADEPIDHVIPVSLGI